MEKWSLSEIWNTVAFEPERPLIKRDYVYASELGGSLHDRYLRMNAVPYTSPPNERSRGKFLAGHIWQHTVEVVLKVAGLYRDGEIEMNGFPYVGCLPVHGRCDIKAGKFDKDNALQKLEAVKLMVPPQLHYKIVKIVEALAGRDLEEKLIEFKSASAYVVEKVKLMKTPLKGHGLQAYYYSKQSGLPADVSYISKDDNFMADAAVTPEMYEDLMRQDLEQITYYFVKKEQPPPDPILWFNNLTGKFEKNILVEYSNYIQLHGYTSPYEFRQAVEPKVKKWNDCIKRHVDVLLGKITAKGNLIKMTSGAEEARKEIITAGYDFDAIIEVKKRFVDESEEEIIED